MAAVAGVYRRILPSPPAIEFASSEGKRLFAKALENGHMEGFFKLISYYQTQSEPAYCGLATLAMVLNSLAIDPARKWKGPWRWFDDSMLDCCEPLEKIKVNGISFGRVACLAQCNGAKVEAFRTNESTVDNFRRHVMSCTSSEDCHMVVTYHRGYLKQTGTGHFSPIGGYHAERDMVLILDVARFKYPPHWVPLTLLWEAMDTVDEATGHRRGFMLISRPNRAPSILYTLSCRHGSWNATAKYLAEDIPRLISSKEIKDVQEMLSLVFTSAPADLRDFINWVAEVRRQEDKSELITEEEKKRLAIKEEVLKQVHETNLYENLTRWLASKSCCKYANNSLTDIASTVCFQGAQLLCGQLGPDGVCCRTSEVKLVESDDNKPVTVISGKVGAGAAASEVDMFVPCCQMKPDSFCACDAKNSNGKHPSVDDVLTVLILAMPPSTWSGIKDERLRDEVLSLVSADTLRPLLQEEILHLRQQLYFITSECTSHA